ncbi:MAG: gliding motility-associated C-terminal domain-containing protein [Marinilabiliaceae bacterium]|nr:gliding motility-associated C-terminal domain-containing protein [Marinilabiliaceae bacterium]
MRLRFINFLLVGIATFSTLLLQAQNPVVEITMVSESGYIACDSYNPHPVINLNIPSELSSTEVIHCNENISKYVYKDGEATYVGTEGYSFDVSVKGGDVSTLGGDYTINTKIDLKLGKDETHNMYYISISPKYTNAAEQGTPVKFVGDSLRVDVYATPSPEVLNDNRLCGYDQLLKANTQWSDISTYSWDISSVDEADKLHITTFENLDSAVAHIITDKQMSLVVKLTETTGKTCVSSTEKELTILGTPSASVWRNDSIGICPKISEKREKVDAYLAAWDTYGGVAPYTVKMSNGATFANVQPAEIKGTTTVSTIEIESEQWSSHINIDNAYDASDYYVEGVNAIELDIDSPDDVYIAEIVDANNCVSEYGTEDHVYGKINVYDRTPRPHFASDTLSFVIDKKREIEIPVYVRDRGSLGSGNTITWALTDECSDYDIDYQAEIVREQDDADGIYTGLFRTNMNGYIKLVVTEANYDDRNGEAFGSDVAECATSSEVTLYMEMPFSYPNAISPNGDGVNDCLRIEGLPDENDVIVCDMHGKKVFEKHNYRNDWSAEGLDDGYYVYVFKGRGTKTVKETLVVKRNNK